MLPAPQIPGQMVPAGIPAPPQSPVGAQPPPGMMAAPMVGIDGGMSGPIPVPTLHPHPSPTAPLMMGHPAAPMIPAGHQHMPGIAPPMPSNPFGTVPGTAPAKASGSDNGKKRPCKQPAETVQSRKARATTSNTITAKSMDGLEEDRLNQILTALEGTQFNGYVLNSMGLTRDDKVDTYINQVLCHVLLTSYHPILRRNLFHVALAHPYALLRTNLRT